MINNSVVIGQTHVNGYETSCYGRGKTDEAVPPAKRVPMST